jgi:Animal haem peroxidase
MSASADPGLFPADVAGGHYSRLCPATSGQWAPHDEPALATLAGVMCDDRQKREQRAATVPRDQVMRSGYVYLGQFIAHDVSRDLRSLGEAGPDVEQTLNYRTPRLELELLYGTSPEEAPHLYESNGRLKLGMTEPSGNLPSTPDDLPRDGDGNALLIDSRSDDNLLIAQIHVLLAKFHNRACDLLTEQPELSVGPVGASLFEQAQRFVVWHYQWIVLHDFLPLVVQEATLRDIEQHGLHFYPRTYAPADAPMALPVEFTLAAFRFGHSMVRSSYFLNPKVGVVTAADLIKMTKRGGGIQARLPAHYVFFWPRFFDGSDATVNRGEDIDTFITPALYDLPALPPAPPGPMGPSLPEMTLKRGSRVRLPSGQELARRFGYPELSPASIAARPEDEEFFRQSGFQERTPLWYYFLREAAVEGAYEPEAGGRHLVQKLGTTGGRIVAETIYQLLNADYDSIVHAGKAWRPPAFVFDDITTPRRLDSMRAVALFANPSRG